MSISAPAREKDQRCRIIATAERLYRQLGFQKTTVGDIARELHMSPANVYRFFGAKAEINEAVAHQLMGEVEVAAEKIASGPGAADERLRQVIKAWEVMNAERYIGDRKLHDMVDVALTEQWPIVKAHIERMGAIAARLIAEGMATGEFAAGDPERLAHLVQTACIRYTHPRMMIECNDKPGPSSDQMIDFCLAALKAGV